ncbi:MAG TPA: tRNA (adenosine(37)-N6)-threonylcarbamoyltransferase complex dimerization subunit type 1 TsaB [Bacteroidia bacterium]|nr:tRNA (adenosine(37)-N6)-threonylcarbamoyltransferase complex dimerization subunit type 1 TsaB [Bacteroidia bacterium]
MKLLLIESSTNICSVALSCDGKIIAIRENNGPNRHAELLTVFCDEVVKEGKITFKDLDAVAVSKGPGSYTGLRIGVSAAKGICYALGKPLIAVGTLEAMANGMIAEAREGDLLCPMIDARRMEVYTAIFDHNGKILKEVAPLVLDENSFSENFVSGLKSQVSRLLFSGDGMPKAKTLLSKLPDAIFTDAGNCSAKNLMRSAEEKFLKKDFEDLAYFEPFYLKTFHPGPKRSEE